MTFIRYIDQKIGDRRLAIIETANRINAEAERRGVILTLRAIYYQFVSRFPEILDPEAVDEGVTVNTQQNYKRLGETLNIGRLAGLVSWEAMEDITRNVIDYPHWPGPQSFLGQAPHWYAYDLWDNQPMRPFMWIEKDAQLGTFQRLCAKHRVPLFSCRGNVSQSEMWKAGQSFRDILDRGQTPVVLYAGDHDPNGLDMTRDVTDRLAMFAEDDIEVRRILLNMDQIQTFNPPPNPVKNTDSRAKGYRRAMEEAGFDPDECFEMDAMGAGEMIEIAENHIASLRDDDRWRVAMDLEAEKRGQVRDYIAKGLDGAAEDE